MPQNLDYYGKSVRNGNQAPMEAYSSFMVHFIKNGLRFCVILIILVLPVNRWLTYYNGTPSHYELQYRELWNPQQSYQGIVLGASHATHAIRPSALDSSGIRFYNLALDGANPEYSFHWYNRIFACSGWRPQYCIFSVTYFMFDSDWLWRRIEDDADYFTWPVFLKMLLDYDCFDKRDLMMNRYPVLKYRKNLIRAQGLCRGDRRYPAGGYDRGFIPFVTRFDNRYFVPKLECAIDSVQIRFFNALLQQMQADGITVVFVMTPLYGIDPGTYQTMESMRILSEIMDRFSIPMLNYNLEHRSEINSTREYFTDWGHMNPEGSRVFSRKLAEDIRVILGSSSSCGDSLSIDHNPPSFLDGIIRPIIHRLLQIDFKTGTHLMEPD